MVGGALTTPVKTSDVVKVLEVLWAFTISETGAVNDRKTMSNPSKTLNPNFEILNKFEFRISDFGFVSCLGFRISNFIFLECNNRNRRSRRVRPIRLHMAGS